MTYNFTCPNTRARLLYCLLFCLTLFSQRHLSAQCITTGTPIANNDGASVCSGSSATINVLNNDSHPEGKTLLVSDFTQPSVGTLIKNNDNTFSYTPPSGFSGTVTFTYTTKADDGIKAFAGNGHYYQYVPSPGICWTDARNAAKAMTLYGMKGYLVTISSAEENAFMFQKVGTLAWLGGSDIGTEGVWKWMDGPEAGQQFSGQDVTGHCQANRPAQLSGSYHNWFPGTTPGTAEPNSCPDLDGSLEHYAHFLLDGTWNDYSNCHAVSGYAVEFGGLEPCLAQLTATATVTITVSGAPAINSVSNQTFCNGSSTSAVTFSGASSYSWTNSNTAIGLAANGTGDLPSFNATNSGTTPISSTITVTPSGCGTTGTPVTFSVTINPTPSVTSVSNQTLCSGTSTTAVSFSGSVSGTVYNWTNNAPSIGLASSGSGNIVAFTATNSGSSPVTATITVTPTYSNGGTTCSGTPTTFTITVNPTPSVNNISDQALCHNTSSTAVTISGPVSGTVYSWTNNNTSIGLGASGTGNIASFTATNSGTTAATATVTITPSSTISGSTCTGSTSTFSITVNPTPTVNDVSNQVLCNSSSSTAVAFSGAVSGTVYNWTNTTPSIGLAASGTGNITSFTATNTTNAPITATITVTPSYTNAGTTCTGTPKTFTITVNPTPSVTQPSNQVVCNNSIIPAITFSSLATGGTVAYSWTNSATSIGLAANGTGNIASFTATNTGTAPVTATIVVTPSFTNSGVTCTGPTSTFTITVNPTATVNTISHQVICNNSSTAAVSFSSPTTGGSIVYNWTNTTPSIGLAASGTGNIASFTGTNASNAPVVATITVTPSFTNGGVTCTGTPTSFTITVNPTPSVTQPTNQPVCHQSTASVTFSSPTTGGTVAYNWTNDNTSIGLAASGTGNIASFTANNPTDVPVTATITVTPSFTNGGVTCTGASKTFTIIVNPLPRITSIRATAPYCQFGNEGRIFMTVAGGTSPNTYSWVGGGFSATTNIPEVSGLSTGNYSVTLTDANGCKAISSTYVPYGLSPIYAPATIAINPNQLNANGVPPTSVTGELQITTGCFTATQVTFTDNIYDIRCGVVVLPDGSPALNVYVDQNLASNAVRLIIRTFVARNGSSIISYSTVQYIYVRSYKLTDIIVPSDYTLQCANSSTDTTITGTPRVPTGLLGRGLANNLSATYTDVRVNNANGFTIRRTWVLKNTCTNETLSVLQNLTFRSDAGTCPSAFTTVSGKIRREDLMEVPANIQLSNAANEMLNNTTSANYSFNNVLLNAPYRITPSRPNTDWLSGVTTFDIALMSRAVLGIAPFTSPYQLIAADVNRSGEVDASDILMVQRLILRVNSGFTNNNSWRFVAKNYVFPDPTNPFTSDFPEVLNVPNLTQAVSNGDFVAIKIGDVNSSLGSTNIRGGVESFKLMVEDKVLEKNQSYEIPVRINPSATALQYALSVDKNMAQVEGITKGDLPNTSDNNFGLFKDDNTVTALWTRNQSQLFDENGAFTMVNLTIKLKQTVRLSEILSINPVYTEGVAYDEKGNGSPVKLSFGNTNKTTDKLTLLPNHPNPFSDQTTISFILPETSAAKVTVYDMMGKVVMATEKVFSKGLNQVVFDAKEAPSVSSGILVVRVQTQMGTVEQKIVLSH